MAIEKNFWKSKKVFITGHEGFLGSNMTRYLVEAGAHVVGLDIVVNSTAILKKYRGRFVGIKGDVANLKLVTKIINQYKPAFIFHLAAEAIVGVANKNPLKTFRTNIEGTTNILEASRDKKFIEAIVVASSDKAYGSHKNLPYTEEAALQGEHPYDVSKSCADLICRTYFVSFGLPVCVTRCGNIYGPGDYNFSRIVPDAIRHILEEKQFVIRSNGKFTRDYIYVDDIVNAYLLLAQKMKKINLAGEAFNFSCEDPISVLNLFKRIYFHSGKKYIAPKILNQARHEIHHQYLSSIKAKKVLGWKPQFNLSQGLVQTIFWYKNHFKS